MTARTTSLVRIILAVSLLTFVEMPSVAFAQNAKGVVAACVSDVRNRCGVTTQVQRQACIKNRFREFSLPCQLAAVKYAAIKKACRLDGKNICGGVLPGEGRIEVCMKDHFEQLSTECSQTISQAVGKS